MSNTLLQALLDGIAIGAVYGLIALGLSLQFGVMKIINFAHGAFMMIAMYVALWTSGYLGLHLMLVMPLVMAILFVVGFGTQRILIEPIMRREVAREPISVLIFTAGLWIFLDNLFLVIAGPDNQAPAGDWSYQLLLVGDLIFTYPQIAGFVISVLVTVTLMLFMRSTRLGRAIRATGQDREAASVLGIDSSTIFQISFAIGLGVLGVAGVLMLGIMPVDPFIGDFYGLLAFVIVILGGLGSIGGALIGGILVGIIESVGGQLMPVSYAHALIFVLFLGVLYFRPSGLFGLEDS